MSQVPCTLIALLLACQTAQAKKPHVVFLFADDMRADMIDPQNHPEASTPTLNSLARRGMVFNNAYCFGGNSPAVCTPSRNMVLSGNAYFRWKDFTPPGMAKERKGLLAPGKAPNFPLTLKAAGYQTYHHGKRGNTAPLIEAQFEINKYLKNDEAERRSGEPGKEIVDEAIAFLQKRKDERPFFLYLAFGNPHDPRVAAEHYRNRYDPNRIPLPANILPVHPFDNGELLVRDERLLPWPRTEADLKRTHLDYLATVSGLDHHMGRLLDELKKTGYYNNTLIVFSADQGIALGSHGLLGKQNLYEHSMKAPLIIHSPDETINHRSDALIYLFDIFPTVCDMIGVPIPDGLDGISFKPVISGQRKTMRSELMLAYRNQQRAIRDDRWKLIRYPELDKTQLFDLQTDPHEMHDLADQAKHAPRIRDMLTRLEKMQRHYGDDQPLTVAAPRRATPVTPALLRERIKPMEKRP